MARVANDPKVGDLVYPAYRPLAAGAVIRRGPGVDRFGNPSVTYRNVKGEDTTSPAIGLRSLDALIEEHERKYHTFVDLRTELREIGFQASVSRRREEQG